MQSIAAFLAFFACVCNASAQIDTTDMVYARFSGYRNQALVEKIYTHLDKHSYAAGEIIWFKLYDVDGIFHHPLSISRVAYVELLGADGRPVVQSKVGLDSGSGYGSLQIPFTLVTGNYLFRAYTNWMKNASPDYFFREPVTVINTLRKPEWPKTGAASPFDIQFLPEGGHLVANIPTRIGFRVADESGHGRDVRGAVVNAAGDTVARFATLRYGLGQFSMTPAEGAAYRAVISIGGDSTLTRAFPAVEATGYGLSVSEANGQLAIRISSQGAVSSNTYLLIHTRGSVKYAGPVELTGRSATVTINRNKLGEGISHITLFNQQRIPVCERLWFRRPDSTLVIQPAVNKQQFGRREKVSLRLPGQAQPEADVSVSVYLDDSLQTAPVSDIQSYLFLSSDLHGQVEDPAYYFNGSGPDLAEATDNLLLTHGWSRFSWENVLTGNHPVYEFAPEFDGHLITGKLIEKATGRPVPNVAVYLSVPGQQFNLKISTSDQQGRVNFDVNDFAGSSEIVLQTNTGADSLYRVDIANPFSDKPGHYRLPVFRLEENLASLISMRSAQVQIDGSFLTDKKRKFDLPVLTDSSAFYGRPDKKYFLDDYTRFTTMDEVMREYVAEVRVRKPQNQYHFSVYDPARAYYFETDPMVLLDGIPIFDLNRIMAFDPLKLQKMEIVTKLYFLDSVISRGIVSYSTYHGDMGGFQLDPNALILEYPGMQLHREFFSPVYEIQDAAASRVPDFRNVLYWSPKAHPGQVLDFFTSDIPGRYRVVVQGLDRNGRAGSATTTFMVSK